MISAVKERKKKIKYNSAVWGDVHIFLGRGIHM